MGKTLKLEYETPALDSPVGESVRGKERERESNSRSPVFEFFKVYLFFNLSNNIGKIFIFSQLILI